MVLGKRALVYRTVSSLGRQSNLRRYQKPCAHGLYPTSRQEASMEGYCTYTNATSCISSKYFRRPELLICIVWLFEPMWLADLLCASLPTLFSRLYATLISNAVQGGFLHWVMQLTPCKAGHPISKDRETEFAWAP